MNKIMIIGGPTGIGKSELAVKLALRYNAVIIGADSMQIYKYMDIGTGKIANNEKCGILHTMIDIVMPNEQYSVQKYAIEAKKIIDTTLANGQLPIIVGGTGLYINAIIHEQNFADTKPDLQIREKYLKIFNEHGGEYLHNLLNKIDPLAAQKISKNDTKRIIRALEIFESTGNTKTNAVIEKNSNYNIKFFIPYTERENLYNRINSRVDSMFRKGLIDEVISLKQYWSYNSMQAIGYKEIIKALQDGNNPLDTQELIKQNSRRYAKRQLTFFKWIKAEKEYISENYFENAAESADAWIKR